MTPGVDGMTLTFDFRGLRCPLPVLKANKALKAIGPGEAIRILATDPAAPKDFRAFCEAAGHELVDCAERDGEIVVVVRKRPPTAP
jgi:tRNA 2-thiouridine synthesizing protein A